MRPDALVPGVRIQDGMSMKAASQPVRASLETLSGSSETESSVSGKWLDRLTRSDYESVLSELGKIVGRHPLVRQGMLVTGMTNGPCLADLVHDLYLELYRKGRFRCYVSNEMTDQQIEREILNLELSNLLSGRLRRERPEQYRMARRIAEILDADPRFRRYESSTRRARRVSERVYGLATWSPDRHPGGGLDYHQAIAGISVSQRDRRRRGSGGSSQIVISTENLSSLLAEILRAIDSPVPLRTLRQLALTRLSLFDPHLISLDELETAAAERMETKRSPRVLAIEVRTPELNLIEREERVEAQRLAGILLERLANLVRYEPQRLSRLLQILWHLYFDPKMPAQIEIARMVGISDSSVSDYRRRLEREIGALSIRIGLWPEFIESLEERLERSIKVTQPALVATTQATREQEWPVATGHRVSPSLYSPFGIDGESGLRPGLIS